MAYICWSLLHRCFGHSFRSHLQQGKYLKIIPVYLLMILLYIWQVYSCYFLHVTYGSLAFTLSPLRTWLTLLTPVLIYRMWTLNSTELGIFMVQLKSHLSSWSLWLTASSLEEVQPPRLWRLDLCPVADGKASISGWASGRCHYLDVWMLEMFTTDSCCVDCRKV